MKIGEKIRELRIAKMMTQSDLAGTKITRNMLSCIENGSASPSLSTVIYLAQRLKVPAGLLLADEEESELYRKTMAMPNVKGAYANKDYESCRAICEAAFENPDDELSLLMADCCLHIGMENVADGNLHSACENFDDALRYAEKTVYPTDGLTVKIDTYFRYLATVSATFYSNVLGNREIGLKDTGDLAKYLDGLDALTAEKRGLAESCLSKISPESFFSKHLKVRLLMFDGMFSQAKNDLCQMLNSSDFLHKIDLFSIFSDLETCCKETEDFRGAYLYANEKMELLERLIRTE